MFCAPKFRNSQINPHYKDERILPIIYKEKLDSPGNAKARVYKIVFHGSYNKLDPYVEVTFGSSCILFKLG